MEDMADINEKIEQLRAKRGVTRSRVGSDLKANTEEAEALTVNDEVVGFKKRSPRSIERNRAKEVVKRSRSLHLQHKREREPERTDVEEPPIPLMPWESDYPYDSDEDSNTTADTTKRSGASDVFWTQAIICITICIAYVVTMTINPIICDKAIGTVREKAAHDFSFRDSIYETVGSFLTFLNQQYPLATALAPPTSSTTEPPDDQTGLPLNGIPIDSSSIGNGVGGGLNPTSPGDVPKDATLAPVIFTGHITAPLKEGSYRVSSSFGFREHPIAKDPEFHTAADLAAPEGTPIYAILAGRVEKSEFSPSLGNYIFIDHGNGFYSIYGHCSKLIANAGDYLRAGEVIAKVGSTGVSTGNHLHFGMKKDGLWFSPSYVFKNL